VIDDVFVVGIKVENQQQGAVMPLPSVYVIGDSISMHYGPYLEKFLDGSFEYSRKSGEEGFGDLDIPTGANGGDSSMVVEFMQFLVKKGGFDRDYLLVNCGLHDIKTDPETEEKQINIGDYTENLKKIAVLAEKLKTKLIWVRTTQVDDEQHNSRCKDFHRYGADQIIYNEAADLVMEEFGVPMIDLCDFTAKLGSVEEIFCDHVHFNDHVRKLQAAYIAGFLGAMADR
jgi:hypothetical protein